MDSDIDEVLLVPLNVRLVYITEVVRHCVKQLSTVGHHYTYLGQYNGRCYELMPHPRMTWEHGESLCKSAHGHLVSITSQGEQSFVQRFLMQHMPDYAIWIGMHDMIHENHFQWTSGTLT